MARWCCPGLKAASDCAGQRGLAIFVDGDRGSARFVLQFRAVDVGNEETTSTSVPTTRVCDATIRFCPWCGEDLLRRYSGELTELRRNDLAIKLGP